MKKRILALLLCAITVFSMVGCSGSGDSLEQVADQKTRSDNPPITLCLYVPSVSKLTKEARESVEAALNAISIKKYNTTLKFFAYPEEEYIPIVLSKVKSETDSYVSYLEKKDEVEKLEKVQNVNYPDNVKATFDMASYPELSGMGIDIFVTFKTDEKTSPGIFDKEGEYYNEYAASNMFTMLYDQKALEALTPRMVNNYAILKSKCYPQFLEMFTKEDVNADKNNIENAKKYAYALPNNYLLGSYTYLIINKEAVAKAGFTQDYELLSYVKYGSKAKNKYESLINTLDFLGAEALGVDKVSGEFASYEEYYNSKESYAIAKVDGDIALPNVIKSDAYAVVEYKAPVYSEVDCGQAAYCVSRAYSATLENQGITEEDRVLRCLDILLLIQDDEDFRNTLQYGVKGEHYSIGRDGTVNTSTNDYVMDPAKTGNMFLLLPSDRMTESERLLAENKWALAKMQNNKVLATKPQQ